MRQKNNQRITMILTKENDDSISLLCPELQILLLEHPDKITAIQNFALMLPKIKTEMLTKISKRPSKENLQLIANYQGIFNYEKTHADTHRSD
jgi:hypothetical protein